MPEEINKTYLLPFPMATIYNAWISVNTIVAPATSMEIDPVVGGIYRLNIDTGNGQIYNEGKFLRIVPEQVIQYTWEWNGDGDITEITVMFADHVGGTQIRLLHSGFISSENLKMHDDGWDSYIIGLTEILNGTK